jgi:hypothetical protein
MGASYYVVVKRRNGGSGDLGAHLMTDQPVSGLTIAGSDCSNDEQGNQPKGRLMTGGPNQVQAAPTLSAKGDNVSSNPKDSDDETSTTFALDRVGMADRYEEQDESIGKSTIATLDSVFEAGDHDGAFDKVWLAPVN